MAVSRMNSNAAPGAASVREVCRLAASRNEILSKSLSSVGFGRRGPDWLMSHPGTLTIGSRRRCGGGDGMQYSWDFAKAILHPGRRVTMRPAVQPAALARWAGRRASIRSANFSSKAFSSGSRTRAAASSHDTQSSLRAPFSGKFFRHS